MFDHVRQQLDADLTRAQNELAVAEQSMQPLRDQLATEQARLAAEQAAIAPAVQRVQSAEARRDAAQTIANQRQAERDTAAANRDNARAHLEAVLDQEPPDQINGKPNPRFKAWQTKIKEAQTALQTAQSALRAAEDALTPAVQERDAAAQGAADAANALADLQARITTIQIRIANLEAAIAAGPGEVAAKREAVGQASMALAALDDRVTQLLAVPIVRLSVERIADQEYAELANLRQQRAELLERRVLQIAEKGRLLAEEDVDVTAMINLRDALAGWPDTVRFAQLASARASIDAVVAAAQQQQGRPTAQRTDNLGAAWARLGEALVAIQAAATQAIGERDRAQTALSTASAALDNHQRAGP
jgi:hypothetical protein